MNFSELTRRVSAEFAIPQDHAKSIVNYILEQIISEIRECRRVYFRGFGSFVKELKPARKYRDPVSGVIKTSPEDLRVRFRSFFNI